MEHRTFSQDGQTENFQNLTQQSSKFLELLSVVLREKKILLKPYFLFLTKHYMKVSVIIPFLRVKYPVNTV